MPQKPTKKVYFCDGAVEGKILEILRKHYKLIFTDKNPDYISYSVMGDNVTPRVKSKSFCV
ncbi:hypothetical protein [uncultured Helicobacter sp.]|uniref:hypothetical protein n=1 Tax=uncultured Helicobacter sp. TaxID=175537 RepID=UPI0025EC4106|nr:hypothetical protein [uncultured Helicobacter sp.]